MRPSTGRHHTWVDPRDLGYQHLGDHVGCRDCGVIWSEFNRNADNCPGVVTVTLRSEGAPAISESSAPCGAMGATVARIEPGWRKAPPTVDEVRVCPWWWNQVVGYRARRILELDVDVDLDGDVHIVIVYRGGASFSSSDRFTPARWGGAAAEWAPCMPPDGAEGGAR